MDICGCFHTSRYRCFHIIYEQLLTYVPSGILSGVSSGLTLLPKQLSNLAVVFLNSNMSDLSSCAQVLTQYLETSAADQVLARPVPTPARQEGPASGAAGNAQDGKGNEFNTFPYPDRLPDSPYVAPTLPDCTPTPPQKSPVTPAGPISTVQSDGSVASQPLVTPASASQMAAGLPDASEVWGPDGQPIPELGDVSAPKPRLGEHHISPEAIRQRAKRVFTPRADGSLKVSQKIFDEWKGRGKARKNLEEIFKQCGYDVDPRMQSGFAIFYSVSI